MDGMHVLIYTVIPVVVGLLTIATAVGGIVYLYKYVSARDITAELDAKDGAIATQTQVNDANEHRIDQLEHRIDQLDHRIDSVFTRLGSVEGEVAGLRQEVAAMELRMVSLFSQFKDQHYAAQQTFQRQLIVALVVALVSMVIAVAGLG